MASPSHALFRVFFDHFELVPETSDCVCSQGRLLGFAGLSRVEVVESGVPRLGWDSREAGRASWVLGNRLETVSRVLQILEVGVFSTHVQVVFIDTSVGLGRRKALVF